MPTITTIGTAAGAKDVAGVTLGTLAGNKTVAEVWIGTAAGNKQVFTAFSVSISGYSEPIYEYPDKKGEPTLIGWGFYVQSTVSGGTAPYSYQWSVVSATVTYAPNPDPTLPYWGAGVGSAETGELTFRCVVTDAAGLIATSNDLTLTAGFP